MRHTRFRKSARGWTKTLILKKIQTSIAIIVAVHGAIMLHSIKNAFVYIVFTVLMSFSFFSANEMTAFLQSQLQEATIHSSAFVATWSRQAVLDEPALKQEQKSLADRLQPSEWLIALPAFHFLQPCL